MEFSTLLMQMKEKNCNKSGKEQLIIKKASEYSDGQKIKINVKFSKWGPFNDSYGYSCYVNRFNFKKK